VPVNEGQEFRGFILSMCKTNYPYGCSEELIANGAADVGFSVSPVQISGHVEYLKDKGYVRVEEVKSREYSRHIVHITPKGIDLLDRVIPEDPGILIPL
jgi:DNA-binding PadR family transcriptional regulator